MGGFGLVICVLLCVIGFGSGRSAEDLKKRSEGDLLRLNHELDEKTAEMELALVQLEADYEKLTSSESTLDTDLENAMQLKDKEKLERDRMEQDLRTARKEVQEKKDSISKLSVHIAEIRRETDALKENLRGLLKSTTSAASSVSEPSLEQVLNNKKEQWGDIPTTLYNKSQKVIGEGKAKLHLESEFGKTMSPTTRAIIVSLILYGGVLAWLYVTYRFYLQLQGRLTIGRVLFLSDAFNTSFWTVMWLLTLLSGKDILYALSRSLEGTFFVIQMLMLVYYAAYVLVRAFVLASRLSFLALGELVLVIMLGHHYYLSGWIPLILGQEPLASATAYAGYSALYLSLALARLSSVPVLYDSIASTRLGLMLGLRSLEKQRLAANYLVP